MGTKGDQGEGVGSWGCMAMERGGAVGRKSEKKRRAEMSVGDGGRSLEMGGKKTK